MRAIARFVIGLTALSTLTSGPAGAVGLGPLRKEGVTDGPAKAFYLTLINPYPSRETFRVYAIGTDSDTPEARVTLPQPEIQLPGERSRRILVIATDLAPGESHTFRVCAERADRIEGPIHARVCSRLTARRLPVRG